MKPAGYYFFTNFIKESKYGIFGGCNNSEAKSEGVPYTTVSVSVC